MVCRYIGFSSLSAIFILSVCKISDIPWKKANIVIITYQFVKIYPQWNLKDWIFKMLLKKCPINDELYKTMSSIKFFQFYGIIYMLSWNLWLAQAIEASMHCSGRNALALILHRRSNVMYGGKAIWTWSNKVNQLHDFILLGKRLIHVCIITHSKFHKISMFKFINM